MRVKTKRYIKECPNCGNAMYTDDLLSDIPCSNCRTEIDFTEGDIEVGEVLLPLTNNDIGYSLSIISNQLTVFLKIPDRFHRELFTIKNPQLLPGFPLVDFSSQYKKDGVEKDIKDWLFKNYEDVFKKLV